LAAGKGTTLTINTGINTGDIFKVVITTEDLQTPNVTKLTENISTVRISDLFVHLGCSLSD